MIKQVQTLSFSQSQILQIEQPFKQRVKENNMTYLKTFWARDPFDFGKRFVGPIAKHPCTWHVPLDSFATSFSLVSGLLLLYSCSLLSSPDADVCICVRYIFACVSSILSVCLNLGPFFIYCNLSSLSLSAARGPQDPPCLPFFITVAIIRIQIPIVYTKIK